MKIVFATHNLNKLFEVKQLLPKNVILLSLLDIGCIQKIPETASTFKGNALLKVNYVKQNYGLDCFAEDSGLEVNALDGKPGVLSARFAGESNNSKKNIKKLLKYLETEKNRKACFKTAVALQLNTKQYFFDGVCNGEILCQKKGNLGFGYDSVFKPNGHSKTFAEMSVSKKNKISHRGKAIAKLITFLSNN